MSDVYLILHGTGGNGPDHWQEHLARSLQKQGKDVRYPKMPEPHQPDLEAWMWELTSTLEAIPADADLTVLAHSRGCILWMHYAALAIEDAPAGPQAKRVLLVAPPYLAPEDTSDLPGADSFFPPPLSQEGIAAVGEETVIIASDDDEFATFYESVTYAETLEIPIYQLSGAGHISPYYGYGDWPWVLAWSLHQADLPPQPKP